MSPTETYLFIGDHAETLSSGRRIAPGEADLPVDVITADEIGKRLHEERLIVKQSQPETKREAQERERAEAEAKAAAEKAAAEAAANAPAAGEGSDQAGDDAGKTTPSQEN